MNVRRIAGLDDAAAADFRNLRRDDKKGGPRPIIAEGRFCARELARSGLNVRAVLVRQDLADEASAWFPADTPVLTADAAALAEVTGFPFHRGVLASADRPHSLPVDGLVRDPPRWTVAPWGVADRQNLGTIIRTAVGFGSPRILFSPDTADPWSRRTVRTSMATVLRSRLYFASRGEEDLRTLVESGFRVVAMTPSNASPLHSFVLDDRPVIWLVGEEGDGLSPAVTDAATERVGISMAAGVDSLNVAVAAGIAMHHLAN